MTRPHSDRRRFLAGLAGGLAGAALVTPGATLHAALRTTVPEEGRASAWDDSWTTRLGPHRTTFDVPDLDAEPGVDGVASVMDAWHEALGTRDADLGMVLVVRHTAVPFLFSDALWARYDLGKAMKEHDEATKAPYRRNPKRADIIALQARGVVVLGCNRAVQGLSGHIASETRASAEAVQHEVMNAILPGVILQPNGLYALARAQDVGCGVIR